MAIQFSTFKGLSTAILLTFSFTSVASNWLLVDDFEAIDSVSGWTKADTKNDTNPKVTNPQVTTRQEESVGNSVNGFLLKKPAKEGIVGNRKALTYKALPVEVPVGETYTFYTRINVESFPNNHAFGISNMNGEGIEANDYNAFEPTLRVTDKKESSGLKNDGALMVKVKGAYSNILNPKGNGFAKPLVPGTWYEIWYVVNNAEKSKGGQTYDVYFKGGDEFPEQAKVYSEANFRMERELPLTHFMMNCNTGPAKKPYGNGGLRYDDIYMVKGLNLSKPF